MTEVSPVVQHVAVDDSLCLKHSSTTQTVALYTVIFYQLAMLTLHKVQCHCPELYLCTPHCADAYKIFGVQ